MKNRIPSPPDFLSIAAAAEWRRLAPKLVKTGALTAETQSVFAAYCGAFATWQEAQQHPQTQTTIGKSGNEWHAPSAWFTVSCKAFAAMARAATMLGLSAAIVEKRRKRRASEPDEKLTRILRPRLAE